MNIASIYTSYIVYYMRKIYYKLLRWYIVIEMKEIQYYSNYYYAIKIYSIFSFNRKKEISFQSRS